MQFVWNVEHTTHKALDTTRYTLRTFFKIRTLAWACTLVYVLKYSKNMPSREETCFGVWQVGCRCAGDDSEGRLGVADDIISIHVFLTNLANTPAVSPPDWMVDTPRCKLRYALCVSIFFAEDLGLALRQKCVPTSHRPSKMSIIVRRLQFPGVRWQGMFSKRLSQIFEELTA